MLFIYKYKKNKSTKKKQTKYSDDLHIMNDVLKQNHNNVPPPTTPKPPFDKKTTRKKFNK